MLHRNNEATPSPLIVSNVSDVYVNVIDLFIFPHVRLVLRRNNEATPLSIWNVNNVYVNVTYRNNEATPSPLIIWSVSIVYVNVTDE
jgi:hypothetical protein